MTIATSIAEPLRTFQPALASRERKIQVAEMMERVGLDQRMINRYPTRAVGRPEPAGRDRAGDDQSPEARDL